MDTMCATLILIVNNEQSRKYSYSSNTNKCAQITFDYVILFYKFFMALCVRLPAAPAREEGRARGREGGRARGREGERKRKKAPTSYSEGRHHRSFPHRGFRKVLWFRQNETLSCYEWMCASERARTRFS